MFGEKSGCAINSGLCIEKLLRLRASDFEKVRGTTIWPPWTVLETHIGEADQQQRYVILQDDAAGLTPAGCQGARNF